MSNRPHEPIGDGSSPYTGWAADVPKAAEKRRKRKRRPLSHTPPISITSLTDCVTLLLVYLLKTFTTSPIEVKEPTISLPASTSQEQPAEATVVMVTGPEARIVVNGKTEFVPATPRLVVDGRPVIELDAATYRVRAADKEQQFVVVALREELRKAKERQRNANDALAGKDGAGEEVSGKIIILADRRTPYSVLTDVLVTCGQAGFGEFRFAVIKAEQ